MLRLSKAPKALAVVVIPFLACSARGEDPFSGPGMPYRAFDGLNAHHVGVTGCQLDVAIAPGAFSLPTSHLTSWIQKSAEAVAVYYGRFPVTSARILIIPGNGAGVSGGQAFGYGGPAIRIRVGTASTDADLASDWVAVHEMVHLALPELPDDNLWMAEGLSVYVEPIARVQAGALRAETIWRDMMRDMPQGLPQDGDKGLDETHTWGRTYWGGALFYLLADVELRKQTGNKIGLQQVMRGVLKAGGNREREWPVEELLHAADRAAGLPVLSKLYAKMSSEPYDPDLPQLWRQLGIDASRGDVTFDDTAPLAAIRKAITAMPRADKPDL